MGCGPIPVASCNPITDVTGALSGAASSAANSVFNSIAKDFGDAASSACTWLWDQIDTATTVDLTSAGIKTDLVATGSIAVVICLALFAIQVLACALRQDMSGLGRAARGLPFAFIGAAFAVATTGIVLTAVDSLSDGVVQYALGTNVQGMGQKLVNVSALTALGNPAGELLLSLVILMAVVVIWVAMMIRKMLIIISAVFAPIAFAGAVSDISKGWVKKWIEFTAALVFSKLILVIIFMIGLSVLDGAGTSSNAGTSAQVTGLVCGALTLLVAGLAPWMAIKLVHFAGDSFHTVPAQASAATAGAQQAAAMPQKLSAMQSKLGGGGSGGGQGGGTGSGSQASQAKNGTGQTGSGTEGSGTPAASPDAASTGSSGAAAGAGGAAAPFVAAGVAAGKTVKDTASKAAQQAGEAGSSAPSHNGTHPGPPGPVKST